MCFSATASFAAAAGLSAMGAVTLREAKTRSSKPLAAIPLLFGIQQAVEGVVWISTGIPWLHAATVLIFVIFSHIFWPVYTPFAIGSIEPKGRRKNILNGFLLVGIALSLWVSFYILRGPVTASSATGCVVYQTTLPPIPYIFIAYVFVTCFTCLFSSHKFIRVFGLALLGALAISFWAYQEALYSVWCFFAAILSFIIYAHLRRGQSLWPVRRPTLPGPGLGK